jgi:hypothetical protein
MSDAPTANGPRQWVVRENGDRVGNIPRSFPKVHKSLESRRALTSLGRRLLGIATDAPAQDTLTVHHWPRDEKRQGPRVIMGSALCRIIILSVKCRLLVNSAATRRCGVMIIRRIRKWRNSFHASYNGMLLITLFSRFYVSCQW